MKKKKQPISGCLYEVEEDHRNEQYTCICF